MRHATWYWKIWWWIGYHGLYQIDWWLKRKGLKEEKIKCISCLHLDRVGTCIKCKWFYENGAECEDLTDLYEEGFDEDV